MRTKSLDFEKFHVELMVIDLTRCSHWFQVDPLPDGKWRITVKDEDPDPFLNSGDPVTAAIVDVARNGWADPDAAGPLDACADQGIQVKDDGRHPVIQSIEQADVLTPCAGLPGYLFDMLKSVLSCAMVEFDDAAGECRADEEIRSLREKYWDASQCSKWLDALSEGEAFRPTPFEDDHCNTCGEDLTDGEGYDGKCGSCADREETTKGEEPC